MQSSFFDRTLNTLGWAIVAFAPNIIFGYSAGVFWQTNQWYLAIISLICYTVYYYVVFYESAISSLEPGN